MCSDCLRCSFLCWYIYERNKTIQTRFTKGQEKQQMKPKKQESATAKDEKEKQKLKVNQVVFSVSCYIIIDVSVACFTLDRVSISLDMIPCWIINV